jgi:RimJ/RimL family protein N-acetyltransferase
MPRRGSRFLSIINQIPLASIGGDVEREVSDLRHDATTMLIGAKVTIGPFVPEDYASLYCWANDIVAARLEGAFRPVNLIDVVRQFENAGKDPSRVMFAIRRRNETAIIGYLFVQNISSVHRSADVGIRIGEDKDRGHGYGTEALTMALDYCWRHLNLNRIGLSVFRHNQRAISLYKAAGFRIEGRLRKLFFVDGAWVDVLLMAAFRPSGKKRGSGRALTQNATASSNHGAVRQFEAA